MFDGMYQFFKLKNKGFNEPMQIASLQYSCDRVIIHVL